MSFSTFPYGQPHKQRGVVLFNLNIKMPNSFSLGLMVILSQSETSTFDPGEKGFFSVCSELENQFHFIDFEKFKNGLCSIG